MSMANLYLRVRHCHHNADDLFQQAQMAEESGDIAEAEPSSGCSENPLKIGAPKASLSAGF
jgi:hypothetical protein